jgi:cbb3-type cytochrome c oxidase subunit III
MKLLILKNTKALVFILWVGVAGVFCLSGPTYQPAASGPVAYAGASGGAEIFAANCARCHGVDGRAKTAKGKRVGATDFTSDWNKDQARGIRIITKGKGEMPAFKGKLSDAEIKAVFSYVTRF